MKRVVFLFCSLIVLSSSVVLGQVRTNGGGSIGGERDDLTDPTIKDKNFKPKLYVTAGAGIANMFGDLPQSIPSPAGRIGIGTRLTRTLVIGIDSYFGMLASKQPANGWCDGFSSSGVFESIDLNAKVNFGNYINFPHSVILRLLSEFYIGSGVGLVNSNPSFTGKFSARYPSLNERLANGEFTQSKVLAPYIPLNFGLKMPLNNFLGANNASLMINIQINYTFSDFIDGYSPPVTSAGNQFNDAYTVFTIGLMVPFTKD